MTSGSLWKNIFLFSIPLMCSQILEVLFNLSDVAIVGKYAGYIPLGSVGSTTLLVSLFTGFLIGMGGGVNVRVAHKLGVGDAKGTEETVHTAALICLVAGLILCLICNIFAEPFLNILHTNQSLWMAQYYISDLCTGASGTCNLQFWKWCFKCIRRDEASTYLSEYCRCVKCVIKSFLCYPV